MPDEREFFRLLRVESDGREELQDQAHGLRRGRDGEKAGRTTVSSGDGSAGIIGIDHPARAPSTSDWRWNSLQATTKGGRRVDETGTCDRKILDPIASSAAVGVVIVPLISPSLHSGFMLSGLSRHAPRSIWQFELEGQPVFGNKTPLGLEHSGGQNDFDVGDGSFPRSQSKVRWQGGC